MTVLLTGATGFVGNATLKHLLTKGHSVHVLLRKEVPLPPGVRAFIGEVQNPRSVEKAAQGCEAAIHLVGIIHEKPTEGITFESVHIGGTRGVLDGCRRAGIRRYLHMSALGTRAGAVSEYHRTKWEAERFVRNSGMDWTIFRPSLILGRDGDFTRQVEGWARGTALPWVAMPYFSNRILGMGGGVKVQPVRVEDVARAFVLALNLPDSRFKAYDVVGPNTFTWAGFYKNFAQSLPPPRPFPRPALGIPAWYARLLLRFIPRDWLPFNGAQLDMALEDNTGDAIPFQHDFGFSPEPVFQNLFTPGK